jgi:hypothetical protein
MNSDQIESKLDVIVTGLAELRVEFAGLSTYVLGMNGGGLGSRVDSLELHIKDCPASEKLEAHYKTHAGISDRIDVLERRGGKLAVKVFYWLSALVGGGIVVWMASVIGKLIINP